MKNDIVIAINNILTSKKGSKYAQLSEIYEEVSRIRNCDQDEALEAQVRARLQEYCSEYKNYLGKEDLFETQSFNSGLWRNKITGEREIKKYVFQLIKEFPGIDITTIQKSLLNILDGKLTEADQLESKTRPGEMKIEQIIRNFVSHKDSYKDEINFVVTDGVTRLYLKNNDEPIEDTIEETNNKNGIDIEEEKVSKILTEETEKPAIDDEEVSLEMSFDIPKKTKRKNNSDKVYIRKSDFESYVNDYKKKLDNGYVGEALVYEYEKNKLIELGRSDLAEKIKWISRDSGDGFGYDIQSFEIENGSVKEIYIEVKSTSSSLTSDFEMSSNELKFAKNHPDNYKLYRIYKNGKKTKGYVVDASLYDTFDITPTSYKVSIKTTDDNGAI